MGFVTNPNTAHITFYEENSFPSDKIPPKGAVQGEKRKCLNDLQALFRSNENITNTEFVTNTALVTKHISIQANVKKVNSVPTRCSNIFSCELLRCLFMVICYSAINSFPAEHSIITLVTFKETTFYIFNGDMKQEYHTSEFKAVMRL